MISSYKIIIARYNETLEWTNKLKTIQTSI